MQQVLRDTAALIIGGSGGIGRTVAGGLAAAGAAVAIAARDERAVAHAVGEIRARGANVSGHRCDATRLADLDPLFEAAAERHSDIRVLVNCQGTTAIGPTAAMTGDEYDRIMDTNLKSVFFACLAAYRHFAGRGGTIINIASLAAHRGWPQAAVYAMSKHGVLGLTRTLAAEWAGEGIRVNSISPGFFMTELNRTRMSEERKKVALARTPAGRFGELEELVGATVFLASDQSRFVTGADIVVDGGCLAGGI
ncbi:MAG: SDR family NAD(P)-dependent oxidoreductase [Alphaproteobacteria bacterium]